MSTRKTVQTKITVSIIGLGKIGAGFDLDGATEARTHLGVLVNNEKYEIKSLVDSDINKLEKIKLKWPAIDPSIFRQVMPVSMMKSDLLVIATPSHLRHEVIAPALEIYNPKVLIIEKPLALSSDEGEKILNEVTERKIHAYVNFHRRFDENHQNFFSKLTKKPSKVVVRYSKGLFNYASHMLDLILNHYGSVHSVQSMGDETVLKTVNDINYSFILRLHNGTEVIFLAMNHVAYDQLELDVYEDRCVYKIRNAGTEMTKEELIEDLYYPGYAQLGGSQNLKLPSIISATKGLYENVAKYFGQHDRIIGCTIQEALYNIKVLEAVVESSKTNRIINL